MSKQPAPLGPCPTIIQFVGHSGTRSLPGPSHHPDHPSQVQEYMYYLRIELFFNIHELMKTVVGAKIP